MGRRLKVAFAMGGGVSLGAFSGGALAEVVRQLATNLDRSRWDAVEIDVLSGASAGGMTVGLLVRALADPDNAGPDDAVRRVHALMHQAWVERIGIETLIPDPAKAHRASLLDREAVDAIARALLAWPGGKAPRDHLTGSRLCMGLTLLNYNGIPISLSADPALGDALATTLFRDYRIWCLDFAPGLPEPPDRWMRLEPEALAEPGAWMAMAATMIAGGAFPLAFEPVALRRFRGEYGKLWPDELAHRDDFPFTFGDGGTFDNEPLRQAMGLLGFLDADEDHDSFDRVLISIDPNVSGPGHDYALAMNRRLEIRQGRGLFDGDSVVAADWAGRLLSNAGRLAEALQGQAAFKDYLGADKVNNRLRWRDESRIVLEAVLDALAESVEPARAEALAVQATEALGRVLGEKRGVSAVPDTALEVEAELRRVARERGDEQADLTDFGTRLACALHALFDQAGALRGKQPVSVWAIAPTGAVDGRPAELAGAFAGGFGGFLDRRYREHDFRLGVAHAGSVLARPPASGPLDCGLLADPGRRVPPPPPLGPDLAGLREGQAPLSRRVGRVAEAVFRNRVASPLIRLLGGPVVRVAGTIVARRATEPQEPVTWNETVVRVRVRGDGGGRVRLLGAGGGEDTPWVPLDADGGAVLDTVVRYPDPGDAGGGEAPLTGPHVRRHGTDARVVLRRRGGHGDLERAVTLPDVEVFRGAGPVGLPIHVVDLEWAEGTQGPWRVEEGLSPAPPPPPR